MPAASREENTRSLVGETSAELLGEKQRGNQRNVGVELGGWWGGEG